MKFVSERDVNFFRSINKELLEDVIDVPVILFKLNVIESPTNIYGEAPSKSYHVGTQLNALINRQDKNPTTDGHILDFNQTSIFSFHRDTLKEKDVYPEVGDIIEYDSSFWEINNAAENQLIADQPFFNWAIICTCHLTRRSALQLEERQYTPNEHV
jgi:hypothetical protein